MFWCLKYSRFSGTKKKRPPFGGASSFIALFDQHWYSGFVGMDVYNFHSQNRYRFNNHIDPEQSGFVRTLSVPSKSCAEISRNPQGVIMLSIALRCFSAYSFTVIWFHPINLPSPAKSHRLRFCIRRSKGRCFCHPASEHESAIQGNIPYDTFWNEGSWFLLDEVRHGTAYI